MVLAFHQEAARRHGDEQTSPNAHPGIIHQARSLPQQFCERREFLGHHLTEPVQHLNGQIQERNNQQFVVKFRRADHFQKAVRAKHRGAVHPAEDDLSQVPARRSSRVGGEKMKTQKNRNWNIGIDELVIARHSGVPETQAV